MFCDKKGEGADNMAVKWGVLGTAGIAAGATIPGMQMAEGCELYAIAGRNEVKVNEFKERFGFQKSYVGYDTLLADKEVQAVHIPLPNHLHYEWVMKAIEAGKHVLCEKPLALNALEAEEMFRAAKRKGVQFAEAYAYLHSPYVASLREIIDSGSIGEVDYIETAFVTQGYEEDYRLHREYGGGAMYDLGCYCTTMMLSLVDSEPAFVKACAEFGGDEVDFHTAGIVKFENGVRASFNVGMIFGKGANGRFDRLYVHGSKGYIRSEVEYNQAGELSYRVMTNGTEETKTVTVRQNYCLEVEQMNRAIEGTGTLLVTPEFSLRNAKLMDAVLREIEY